LHQFASGPFQLAATVDLPDAETGGAKLPAVLFCHGFSGHRIESRRIYSPLRARLAGHRTPCLRFHHRRFGVSDGGFNLFTPRGMLEDLDRALEQFLSMPWLDQARMAIVGYSLGGLSASYLLHRDPRFLTAALWAPVARPDIIRDRLAQYPAFDGYRERGYM